MEQRGKRRRKGGLLKKAGSLLFYLMLGAACFCLAETAVSAVSDRLAERKAAYSTVYETAYTIAENLDTLQGLRPEIWAGLSETERLTVLQTVANCEANYLGIPKPLPVVVTEMPDTTLGFYHIETHEIHINPKHLRQSPVQDVCATICHEAYHGYQFAMAEAYAEADPDAQNLLFFSTAAVYLEEFAHYVNGQDAECYDMYYDQKLEKDARDYSVSAVLDYYSRLDEAE